MSISLRFLPIDVLEISNIKGAHSCCWGFSHQVLEANLGSEAYDAIEELDATVLPKGHRVTAYVARIPDGSHKDESGYGVLEADASGKPYHHVSARDLAAVLAKYAPGDPVTCFMQAIGPDTRVILDWH